MAPRTDNGQSAAGGRPPVISITALCKSFGSLVVLNRFDLDVHHGENVVVLGKSGSGKSVLIKCIGGLLKPDSGSIRVLDHNIHELGVRELDRVRAKIGFLFQNSALYDSMTVRENLEFPMRRHLQNIPYSEQERRMRSMLDNVGLPDTLDMMPEELSGGMKKRIGLARALILNPEIVLYDEPTTGLDPITGGEIVQLMLDLQKKFNTSSVIISHDIQVAKKTANRIIVLYNGCNHAEGTFDELEKSEDSIVKQFFKNLT